MTMMVTNVLLVVVDSVFLNRESLMRVIRDASKEIEKIVICKNCGTELGYVPADIKTRRVSDYTGGVDTYNEIKCPKCRKLILV